MGEELGSQTHSKEYLGTVGSLQIQVQVYASGLLLRNNDERDFIGNAKLPSPQLIFAYL